MRWLLMSGCMAPAMPIVWLSATGTESFILFLYGCFAGFAVVALLLVLLHFNGSGRRGVWHLVAGACTALAVVASVVFTAWPLEISHALSQPALDRLVASVRRGEPPDGPQRAGLFVIQQAELSHKGVVCLWTDLHWTGRTGFLHCGVDRLPGNLWSHLEVDENWQFVTED